MALASTIAAFCLFTMVYAPSYFDSLKYVFSFTANIFFWKDAGNYWSTPAVTKPLLHTWSLGVEEQFYILFPLVLFLLVKYLNKHVLKALVILWVISFALNVHLIFKHQPLVFYMLPFRAWELLTGSILAIYQAKYPSSARAYSFLPLPLRASTDAGGLRVWGNVAGIAGLLLICISVVWLDYARKSHFPGTLALMPVMGAFLCISAEGSGVAGRLLSWKPFVHIGKLSYSMYLWHWPLMVFWKYQTDETDLSLKGVFIVVLLTYILSVLSYRFVEQPVRHRQVLANRKFMFTTATMICCAIIAASIAWQTHNKLLLPLEFGYMPERMDYMKRCVERDVLESKENKSDEPIVLITGDSYAETQFPLWEKLSRGSGKRIDFFMCFGAIPGMRLEDSRLSINQDRCMHLLEQAVREDNIADFVITLKLATRLIGWTAYERNTHPDETEYYYITENELKGLSALENGLEQTIKLVKQYHKGARVWLQMQPPEFPFNVSDHADKNKDTKMLRKNYNERVKPIIEILNKFGENLHLIDLASRLCDDTYCYGVIDGTVMYIDHDHISPEGGLKLIELYEPIFANH